jgi:hypothetical protein
VSSSPFWLSQKAPQPVQRKRLGSDFMALSLARFEAHPVAPPLMAIEPFVRERDRHRPLSRSGRAEGAQSSL